MQSLPLYTASSSESKSSWTLKGWLAAGACALGLASYCYYKMSPKKTKPQTKPASISKTFNVPIVAETDRVRAADAPYHDQLISDNRYMSPYQQEQFDLDAAIQISLLDRDSNDSQLAATAGNERLTQDEQSTLEASEVNPAKPEELSQEEKRKVRANMLEQRLRRNSNSTITSVPVIPVTPAAAETEKTTTVKQRIQQPNSAFLNKIEASTKAVKNKV